MKQPNAKQKRFMSDISEYVSRFGHVINYVGSPIIQMHHVAGRSYVQDKVKIGHWFVLPLPIDLHDIRSNNSDNVTYFPKNFTERYGTQRSIFKKMVKGMRKQGLDRNLPPDEVMEAIANTRY